MHAPAQRLSRKECGRGVGGRRRRTYLVNEQFNELFTADIVTAMVGFGGKGRGVGVCYCSSLGGRDQHQQARRGKRVVAALFNNESAVRFLSKLNSHNKIMARGSSFLFQRVEQSAIVFFNRRTKEVGEQRQRVGVGSGGGGSGGWSEGRARCHAVCSGGEVRRGQSQVKEARFGKSLR